MDSIGASNQYVFYIGTAMKQVPWTEKELPPFLGKMVSLIVFIVALTAIYYGIHDGVLNREIAARGKLGNVVVAKGVFAVIVGIAFTWMGILLIRLAKILYNSSK